VNHVQARLHAHRAPPGMPKNQTIPHVSVSFLFLCLTILLVIITVMFICSSLVVCVKLNKMSAQKSYEKYFRVSKVCLALAVGLHKNTLCPKIEKIPRHCTIKNVKPKTNLNKIFTLNFLSVAEIITKFCLKIILLADLSKIEYQ